jgi:threonine/homoserine/homoserine lactone efflux protein
MFSAIYEGILLGLVLAFSFGPGFFALINTGIKSGFKQGAALAIGIVASDLFLVLLIFVLLSFGASGMLSDPKNQAFIGVIGGIVLIIYGSINFYSKTPKTEPHSVKDFTNVTHLNIEREVHVPGEEKLIERIPHGEKHPSPVWLAVKGFFINLLNPFVWIFWLATATAVGSKFEFKTWRIVVFFTCTLGVIISTDLLKVFVAGKIKKFLTQRLMRNINYVSGVILIAFGLYLIYKVFFMH